MKYEIKVVKKGWGGWAEYHPGYIEASSLDEVKNIIDQMNNGDEDLFLLADGSTKLSYVSVADAECICANIASPAELATIFVLLNNSVIAAKNIFGWSVKC